MFLYFNFSNYCNFVTGYCLFTCFKNFRDFAICCQLNYSIASSRQNQCQQYVCIPLYQYTCTVHVNSLNHMLHCFKQMLLSLQCTSLDSGGRWLYLKKKNFFVDNLPFALTLLNTFQYQLASNQLSFVWKFLYFNCIEIKCIINPLFALIVYIIKLSYCYISVYARSLQ